MGRTVLWAAWIVLFSVSATAQTYSWATRTGGTPPGVTEAGATVSWGWGWSPGGQSVSGTIVMTRTGAGSTYSTSETLQATIVAGGALAPAFDNSTFANSVGGVAGIRHFVSEGELGRAANDAAQADSTTVMNLMFAENHSSPHDTLIAFFDPGAFEAAVHGPFTYTFSASDNGVPVNTSQWGIQIEDPYSPSTNATTGIIWNGTTLTVPNFLNGRTSGENYPDTLVFLDTNNTTFDTLTVVAVGPNVDTFAIGFGANTLPIPEPSAWCLVSGMVIAATRRKRLMAEGR